MSSVARQKKKRRAVQETPPLGEGGATARKVTTRSRVGPTSAETLASKGQDMPSSASLSGVVGYGVQKFMDNFWLSTMIPVVILSVTGKELM